MGKLYFEDLEIGHVDRSAGRTITETDFVQFAMFSGNWDPIHVDQEVASRSLFGKRVAHGLLGVVVGGGLARDNPPRILAFLRVEAVFRNPLFLGDTVYAETEVAEKLQLPSRTDGGVVVFKRRLLNQHDVVVQEVKLSFLVEYRVPHSNDEG